MRGVGGKVMWVGEGDVRVKYRKSKHVRQHKKCLVLDCVHYLGSCAYM